MFSMKDKIVISFDDETVYIEAHCSGQDLIIGALAFIKEIAKVTGKEVSEVTDFLKLLSSEDSKQNKEGEN